MKAEKRTKGALVDGVYLPANACSKCNQWLPPYKAGVPAESAHLYCWGHDPADHREDA